MTKIDRAPYYVAHGERFGHVRGLDAAQALLAGFLGVPLEAVRAARKRRNCAGLIQRVDAATARAAGL